MLSYVRARRGSVSPLLSDGSQRSIGALVGFTGVSGVLWLA